MKSTELTSNKINSKGFTLIEVLIAMVIFSFGILAVAQMQIRALHGNSDAFSQTEATMWASNQAETLIALPFTHANLIAGTYFSQAIPFYFPSDTAQKYGLSWVITNNNTATVPAVNISKSIVITVYWSVKSNDVATNYRRTVQQPFNYIKALPI